MITGKNLIKGEATNNEGGSSFRCLNAKSKKPIAPFFEEANEGQVATALAAAEAAFPDFAQTTTQQRAALLSKIKETLAASEEGILARYQEETGYPEGRAQGEFQRTLSQIQSFVDLLEDGSYLQVRIHATEATPDIRKMLFPLGPIAVFGASNFPLAFSTAGGDTISALAAGCPVLLKAHPYHAGTSEWVAQCIVKAIADSGLPPGIFSHLNGESHHIGAQLVMHSAVKGVGFTGSFRGGKALYDLAQTRSEPIPVFAEMGSINPIFILPNRLQNDSQLATQIASSIALGCGQFCTNPGLVVIQSEASTPPFIAALQEALWSQTPNTMVHPNIEEHYDKSLSHLTQEPIQLTRAKDSSAALGVVSAAQFIEKPQLQEEVFGPYSLVVHCQTHAEMQAVLATLPGQLTLTLLGAKDDHETLQTLVPLAGQKAGRLLFEGVPTGVAVTQAMQHGGPYPATTDGRFTSVGTDAIYRWLRPISFQDCNTKLLPPALQKENPLKLWRSINGTLTQNAG